MHWFRGEAGQWFMSKNTGHIQKMKLILHIAKNEGFNENINHYYPSTPKWVVDGNL